MAGGIQPGTSATTKESASSEKNHINLVSHAISLRPNLSLKKSVLIEDIANHPAEYSKCANGKSQWWEADGGFVTTTDGKIIGVCENKYQKARKNACERVCKYLTFLKGDQMFVSCYGPGFILKDGGGSTGPTIDMLRSAGAVVLENEADAEFLNAFNDWLDSLVEKYL